MADKQNRGRSGREALRARPPWSLSADDGSPYLRTRSHDAMAVRHDTGGSSTMHAWRNRLWLALALGTALVMLPPEPVEAQTGTIAGTVTLQEAQVRRRTAGRYPGGPTAAEAIQQVPDGQSVG